MAEAKRDNQATPQAKPGRKLPIKTIIILAVVLLLEALTVVVAFMVAGGPANVQAGNTAVDQQAVAQQPTEVLIIDGRFQNTRAGIPFIYDTQIIAVVQKRHEAKIKSVIKSMEGQISEDVSTIFRRAELAHLREASLSTIKLQVKNALDERLGRDDEGKSLIQTVLIPRCTEMRADL